MTVQEFLAWAAAQPRGRYELVRGEVVAMAPERARHNLVKAAVFRALSDAVARAALPCTVFTDGMTVVIDNEHSREPDAAVQCNITTDSNSTILEAPLIVVEVASPSSERDDTATSWSSISRFRAFATTSLSIPKRAWSFIMDATTPVISRPAS